MFSRLIHVGILAAKNKFSKCIYVYCIANVLFTLNRTKRSSVLQLCVVRFNVNKTLSNNGFKTPERIQFNSILNVEHRVMF